MCCRPRRISIRPQPGLWTQPTKLAAGTTSPACWLACRDRELQIVSEIKTVGVIGAGTMGNGIAHVFARSGFTVRLCEVEQRFLDRGLDTIRTNRSEEHTSELQSRPHLVC